MMLAKWQSVGSHHLEGVELIEIRRNIFWGWIVGVHSVGRKRAGTNCGVGRVSCQGEVGQIAQTAREPLLCLHLQRVIERGAIHLISWKVAGKLRIRGQRLLENRGTSELLREPWIRFRESGGNNGRIKDVVRKQRPVLQHSDRK